MKATDFSSIYQSIIDTYEHQTGNTVYDDTDLAIRMKIVAGELYNAYEQLAYAQKQMFPQTASGQYLDRHGACRDIARKTEDYASGTVQFYCDSAASKDIVIPKGTLCSCSTGNGVIYQTDSEVTLLSGTTSVDASVTATQTGPSGNAVAGKVDTMVNVIAGISGVRNLEAIAGGMDEEDDEHYRDRILYSFLNLSTGANTKYYEDLAMSVNNVWSAKAYYNVSHTAITLFVSDIFRLTPQSLINRVAQTLDGLGELNVNVSVQAPQVVTRDVSLNLYVRSLQGADAVMAQITQYITNKIYNLGIGESLNPYTITNDIKDYVDNFVSLSFNNPTTISTVDINQIIKPGLVDISVIKG